MAKATKKSQNNQDCSPLLRERLVKACQLKETRRLEVDINNPYQHQQRAGKGVYEEFECNGYRSLAAPHGAEEVYGDERQFPEEVEQQRVVGEKYAQQARPAKSSIRP